MISYIWTSENDMRIKEGRQLEKFDLKNVALLGLTKLVWEFENIERWLWAVGQV